MLITAPSPHRWTIPMWIDLSQPSTRPSSAASLAQPPARRSSIRCAQHSASVRPPPRLCSGPACLRSPRRAPPSSPQVRQQIVVMNEVFESHNRATWSSKAMLQVHACAHHGAPSPLIGRDCDAPRGQRSQVYLHMYLGYISLRPKKPGWRASPSRRCNPNPNPNLNPTPTPNPNPTPGWRASRSRRCLSMRPHVREPCATRPSSLPRGWPSPRRRAPPGPPRRRPPRRRRRFRAFARRCCGRWPLTTRGSSRSSRSGSCVSCGRPARSASAGIRSRALIAFDYLRHRVRSRAPVAFDYLRHRVRSRAPIAFDYLRHRVRRRVAVDFV